MFESLTIPLRLGKGDVALVGDVSAVSAVSDGQFQSDYIYAISTLFKDRNCIAFLTHPYYFLHPVWQFGFLKQVVNFMDKEAARINHVLLSSLCPSPLKLDHYIGFKRGTWDGTETATGLKTGRFLPRDTQLEALSNRYMKAICDRLNGTPRKCLGWRTPKEVFETKLMEIQNRLE